MKSCYAMLTVLSAMIVSGFMSNVSAARDWSGFYVGGNLGYGAARSDAKFEPLPSAAQFVNLQTQTLHPRPNGFLGGAQLGYNWQMSRLLLGLEADIQGTNWNSKTTSTPIIQNNGTPFPGTGFVNARQRTNWFTTIRPRFGFTLDRLLAYITAGGVIADMFYSASTDFRPVGSTSYTVNDAHATKWGWTVGAGGEWALDKNWSFKLEYLHYDVGSTTIKQTAIPVLPPFQVQYTFKTQADVGRIGFNYKF